LGLFRSEDGAEYFLQDPGQRGDAYDDQLPEFGQQAGLEQHGPGSSGNQCRQSVLGYLVASAEIAVAASLNIGEAGNQGIEFGDGRGILPRVGNQVNLDDSLATQEPDGVVHAAGILRIVASAPDGPGEIVGERIIVGCVFPSNDVEGGPAFTPPLLIGFFRSLFDVLQHSICIQAVFVVVFDVAGLFIAEHHEPGGALAGGNQDANFFSIGNVLRHLKHSLRAGFAGKSIALRYLDLRDAAEVPDGRTALPINLDVWLLW